VDLSIVWYFKTDKGNKKQTVNETLRFENRIGSRLQTKIKTGPNPVPGPYCFVDILVLRFINFKTPDICVTPRSRDLLEKLTCSQLVKKFPSLYGAQRFITASTRSRQNIITW